ncbi:hypothetical protein ACFQJ5_01195 [Halomicroarcula sp. GCM10025324]|uniref:hypothetical protein n=1 Tax=Haloarcula TaxID=2237 RepID=UPI0023E7DF93|nr:hypothetical protein [Halomicroarcula sp. ZS-22-S1]
MTEEGTTDETEPDATYYSQAISRRELLAVGATAAASGMAGCGECYGPQECGAAVSKEVGSVLEGETEEGPSREEEYERTRTQLEVVEGYDLEFGEVTLDSVQLTLKNGLLPHQQPEEAVEGTLRVYGNVPVGGSDVLGETGASLRGGYAGPRGVAGVRRGPDGHPTGTRSPVRQSETGGVCGEYRPERRGLSPLR